MCDISIPNTTVAIDISAQVHGHIKAMSFLKCIFKGIYNNGEEKTI
jgi:hypothetical protein